MVDGFVVDGRIIVCYFVVAGGGFLLAGLSLLSWLLVIGNLYNGWLLGPLLVFLNFITRTNAPLLHTHNRPSRRHRDRRKSPSKQRVGLHLRVEGIRRHKVRVVERLRKRGVWEVRIEGIGIWCADGPRVKRKRVLKLRVSTQVTIGSSHIKFLLKILLSGNNKLVFETPDIRADCQLQPFIKS